MALATYNRLKLDFSEMLYKRNLKVNRAYNLKRSSIPPRAFLSFVLRSVARKAFASDMIQIKVYYAPTSPARDANSKHVTITGRLADRRPSHKAQFLSLPLG